MAQGIAYVANRPGAGIGTPSAANTTLHRTLAAAKASPLPDIASALKLAGPDVTVVLGPGDYHGQLRLTQRHSGTPGHPFRIVSETLHGARIIGPSGGGEASAVWTTGCYDLELHNLLAEVRAGAAGDNAAFKIFRNSGDGFRDTGIVLAGCKARGRGRDGIKVSGMMNARIVGCDVSSEGGSFAESGIDANLGWGNVIEFNSVTGRMQNGIAVKGGALRPMIRRNWVTVQQLEPGVTFTPALYFGHSGISHTGSQFPFGGMEWDWAEINHGVAEDNFLSTDWRIAIWCVGSHRGRLDGNVLSVGRPDGHPISEKASKTGKWSDMPPIPAKHAPYVHTHPDNPDWLALDTRFTTGRNNAVLRSGAGTGATLSQHPGTDDIHPLVMVDAVADHISGAIGPSGWDHDAILRTLDDESSPLPAPGPGQDPGQEEAAGTLKLSVASDLVVTVEDNAMIRPEAIGHDGYNLIYEPGAGEAFGSVVFDVDSGRLHNVQNHAPYELFSPAAGRGVLFPAAGQVLIRLTFHAGRNAGGAVLRTAEYVLHVRSAEVPGPEPQPGLTLTPEQVATLRLELGAIMDAVGRIPARVDAISDILEGPS